MLNRPADPRTDDLLVYELLRTPRGAAEPEVVGRASFRGGQSTVEGPDNIRISVEELLGRAFVDRVQADERPRGYRRTGRGSVDMLVPGMAEHFIARLRGLWLSYPDGSVVTAREAAPESPHGGLAVVEVSEAGPPISDSTLRRATLADADERVHGRALVRAHPPEDGVRPAVAAEPMRPVGRTDCGWLI